MIPNYTLKTQLLDWPQPSRHFFPAVGDLNADGRQDLVILAQYYPLDGNTFDKLQPQQGRVFLAQANGTYALAPSDLFPIDDLRTVHARKTLFVDLNGDGRKDLFIADHGWDAPPYPGYPNHLFLSTLTGGWRNADNELPRVSDFSHGAAAADIDGDGDLDIVVLNGYNHSTNPATNSYVLINDGSGRFTRADDRLPAQSGQLLYIWSANGKAHHLVDAEFSDLDGDRLPDLVVMADAAHDFNAFRQTTIFWNLGGRFDDQHITRLSEPYGMPSHIDMNAAFADFNGDGVKDIVVVGTNGQPFYDGSFVQMFYGLGNRQYTEVSDQVLPQAFRNLTQPNIKTGNAWPIRVHTLDINRDGAPDFAIDFVGVPKAGVTPLLWLNDGSGRFSVVTVEHFMPLDQQRFFANGQWIFDPDGPKVYEYSPWGGQALLHVAAPDRPWFGRIDDSGDETVIGTAGNDRLVGGGGDDDIDGGAGWDSAAYFHPRSAYEISYLRDRLYQVRAKIGDEGTDVLTNIEVLRFGDGLFVLTPFGAAKDLLKAVQAFWGRSPTHEEFALGLPYTAAHGGEALSQFLAQELAHETAAGFAAKVIANFGITLQDIGGNDPAATLVTLRSDLEQFWDNHPSATDAAALLWNILAQTEALEADPVWGKVARQFNDRLAHEFLQQGYGTLPVTVAAIAPFYDMMID